MLNIPVFVPRFLLCRAGERTEVIIGLCFLDTKSPATAVHPCVRPLSVRALRAEAHILFQSSRPKNVILPWRDSSLPENTWPSKCSSWTCDLIWPWRSGCSYLLCILYPSTRLANHFLNNCQPENLSGLRVLDFLRDEKPRRGGPFSRRIKAVFPQPPGRAVDDGKPQR